MEMPNSIKRFEMFFLGSLVLGIFQSAILQNSIGIADSEFGMGVAAFSLLVSLFVGAIVLATSRKKSVVCKWVLTVFSILGLIAYIPTLAVMMEAPVAAVISGIQFALQAFGIYELFSAESKKWFASRNNSDEPAE